MNKDWWFNTSSSFCASFAVLLLGFILARPAYDNLYQATQRATVDMGSSQGGQVTINQGVELARLISDPNIIASLPESLKPKMMELRRASEDILETPGSWDALDQPVGVTWDTLSDESWDQLGSKTAHGRDIVTVGTPTGQTGPLFVIQKPSQTEKETK